MTWPAAQVSVAGQSLEDGDAALPSVDTKGRLVTASHATGYETVAASQTDQALGATGAVGDLLQKLVITPTTTSPGVVSIKDGAGSAITVLPGGASSVTELKPIVVDLGMKSAAGAWSVTTGLNVSVIAVGDFT